MNAKSISVGLTGAGIGLLIAAVHGAEAAARCASINTTVCSSATRNYAAEQAFWPQPTALDIQF